MRHHQRYLIHVLLSAVFLMTLVGKSATAQDSENLLQNGGFEGTYIAIGGDPSLQLAPNWQPWSLPPPEGAESSAVNLRPDYQSAPANRVRSGNAAQEYNTFFATHDGGVYQRVPVSPGAELEFSVYVYVWSSATFENPDESVQPQDVDVMVGIDPTGGQDGASDDIIWSDPSRFYDEYRQLSVSATAQGNAVTVFVRSTPQQGIGVNNIYVDDAALIQTGTTEAPEPTEEVADATDEATEEATEAMTEEATQEATEEATEEATDEATQEATDESDEPTEFPNRVTHVVQPGDTVIALAIRYDSTVEAIIAANGLNNAGLILVGQSLVIPVPEGQGTASGTPTATATQTTGGTQPTQPTTQTPGRHVVQAGETLYRIALRYNTTVEALATLNNITNPNRITAGTVLQVPTGGSTGGTTGGAQLTHVVQPGENAFRVGLRYNITVERLAQANGLVNPNLIYAGQVLVIPR